MGRQPSSTSHELGIRAPRVGSQLGFVVFVSTVGFWPRKNSVSEPCVPLWSSMLSSVPVKTCATTPRQHRASSASATPSRSAPWAFAALASTKVQDLAHHSAAKQRRQAVPPQQRRHRVLTGILVRRYRRSVSFSKEGIGEVFPSPTTFPALPSLNTGCPARPTPNTRGETPAHTWSLQSSP